MLNKIKYKISMLFLRKFKCPICGYQIGMCQCRYGGSAHPDRNKNREVVLQHLYLLSKPQLNHVIYLERFWRISYGDDERKAILKKLESEGKNE